MILGGSKKNNWKELSRIRRIFEGECFSQGTWRLVQYEAAQEEKFNDDGFMMGLSSIDTKEQSAARSQ